MTTLLESLGRLRRPQVGPFFAARVLARTAEGKAPRPVPWFLWLYWLVLLVAASRLLVGSPAGLAIAAAVAAVVAFPAGSLAFLLRTFGALVREDGREPRG